MLLAETLITVYMTYFLFYSLYSLSPFETCNNPSVILTDIISIYLKICALINVLFYILVNTLCSECYYGSCPFAFSNCC